jgi:hypothetical protein
MASVSQGAVTRRSPSFAGRNGLVDRYFYFAASLLIAVIVVCGFSLTIDQSLFHAAIPRPLLLWIHGAAFSAWVAFYILQSALVRTHHVKVHRLLGWFGTALAATMVVLGIVIAVIMGRFDAVVLHQPDPAFLSIPFYDMVAFGTCVGLAISWRKKPELHRRLLFIATCALLDAPFGRVLYIFNHALFYPLLDGVILLGVARDLIVNRNIHKVYRVALPLMILLQGITIYLWRGSPAWWLKFCQNLLA